MHTVRGKDPVWDQIGGLAGPAILMLGTAHDDLLG